MTKMSSTPSGPSAEPELDWLERYAQQAFGERTRDVALAAFAAYRAALGASASAAGHREERERLAVVCERLAMWHLEKYGRDPEVADLRSIAARLRQPIGPAWDDGTASAEPPPEPIR